MTRRYRPRDSSMKSSAGPGPRLETGMLQTALCYLEAVRSKVPEVLQTEKTTSECMEAPEP
ncbi:hypothetical protein LXA43DRAFT_133354 [Ganoderma leucocontextum]|nr:hypothetical protein LXA43DRAFT_133144 [Ganoderma leucocontextum]KAI1794283.1 hypothetical protein LXA43DRAFT_133354 [Ganoderma leucocontextum]